MPDVYLQIPYPYVTEGSSLAATARFNVGDTATAPTTASYRIDCLTSGKKLKDWTSLTPSSSIDITVTGTENAIQDQGNANETKQMTVASDPDTDGQIRGQITWKVKNLRGFK